MLGRILKDLFAPNVRLRPGQTAFQAGVEAYKAGELAAAAEYFAATLRAEPAHPEAHGRGETRAIGIDPEPKITQRLAPGTSIHATTSDEYFAAHDVRAEFGGLPIDLAFIDGMHWFEFALRDFMNIERHCTPRSTILIHDCYPLSRHTAERERRTAFWSGDIWRLVLLLRKYRPDLSVKVIGTAPTGLGVVRGLDPGSSVLREKYDAIVGEFLALD